MHVMKLIKLRQKLQHDALSSTPYRVRQDEKRMRKEIDRPASILSLSKVVQRYQSWDGKEGR